ncbi:MAG TPA: trypsin-like serine protease [Thermoanaerobaculia bacterium]|jgi:V8-like Glu-specific endopeptidase|nr:trypsin-like serine protease [Thermoanaerobaculia bacterium]
MRRLSLVAVAVCLLLLAASAHAITYGYVDQANQYSNVGAFIVERPSDGHIFPICSGTLITSNVFLTASHCTDFFTRVLEPLGFTAYVSFDNPVPYGALTTAKTRLLAVSQVVTNPLYNQAQSDTEDIAVLILKQAQKIAPATLPVCGLLDQLAAQNGLKGTVYTAVGYGVQERVVGGGQPYFKDANPVPRMFAYSSFDSLNNTFLRLSQNPSTGDGGTCYGDSGGPNFATIDGQLILVAITITGDTPCRSTNVDYRTDTRQALAFFSWVNATYGTSIPVSSC